MSVRLPWFCPACQKHHGPHVDTCPGIVDAIPGRAGEPARFPPVIDPTNWPARPIYPYNPPPTWGHPIATCSAGYPSAPSIMVAN